MKYVRSVYIYTNLVEYEIVLSTLPNCIARCMIIPACPAKSSTRKDWLQLLFSQSMARAIWLLWLPAEAIWRRRSPCSPTFSRYNISRWTRDARIGMPSGLSSKSSSRMNAFSNCGVISPVAIPLRVGSFLGWGRSRSTIKWAIKRWSSCSIRPR